MDSVRRKFKENRGSLSIMMAITLVMLMAIMAYVVDVGLVYAEGIKLSNALDAATLAAAMELPGDRDEAFIVANAYLLENGVDVNDVTILIGDDNKSIEIEGKREVEQYFVRLFGIESSVVQKRSKVALGAVKSVKGGIRPFAVEKSDFQYGDLITLKEGAGEGVTGNYGVLALGGTGADVAGNNVRYGYDGEVKIGDRVDTEPGNLASVSKMIQSYINSIEDTFNDFETGSDRVWVIPLVESLELNGRTDVEIVGFAQIFAEDVQKKAGKIEVEGRFIEYAVNGEVDFDLTETGVYGIKLME